MDEYFATYIVALEHPLTTIEVLGCETVVVSFNDKPLVGATLDRVIPYAV